MQDLEECLGLLVAWPLLEKYDKTKSENIAGSLHYCSCL